MICEWSNQRIGNADCTLIALVGGLCDPDSVVVWTAVDCLKIVLKREDARGHKEMGNRVLQVAVPLARLR
jgi:hypothetical protein